MSDYRRSGRGGVPQFFAVSRSLHVEEFQEIDMFVVDHVVDCWPGQNTFNMLLVWVPTVPKDNYIVNVGRNEVQS